MVNAIIEFLRPYLSPPWGYVIVGLATLLENSIGIGVIVPGETIVILGGVYASEVGKPPLWLPGVMIAAATGAVIGDNIGYWIGRRFGRGFLERHGHRLFISKERLDKGDEFYRKHGGKTVFLARFVPVARSVGIILAGVSEMPWKRFFMYDVAGAVLWAVGNTLLGYVAGRSYDTWEGYANQIVLGIVIVAALVVGGSKFVSWRRNKKAEASKV
ncbi:MAG: DedA family protein [Actinomycetota bacterium]